MCKTFARHCTGTMVYSARKKIRSKLSQNSSKSIEYVTYLA